MQVSGAITFPNAPTEPENKDDFTGLTSVLELQLTNLFTIADSNDKVLDCIAKIEDLKEAESPERNEDLDTAETITEMCGQSEPPVDKVQEASAAFIKVCNAATSKPNEGQLKSLIFIKKSLLTFKQTFTSQITVFSQRLTDITGTSVTASSLSVTVILETGEIGTAKEVNIDGGKEVGSIEFFTFRYEVVKSCLNSISKVITKITNDHRDIREQ